MSHTTRPMRTALSSAIVLFGLLALPPSFAHAADRRTLDITAAVPQKSKWSGYVAGDDNFAVVSGPGSNGSVLMYEGKSLPLSANDCPAAMKGDMEQGCAKLPGPPADTNAPKVTWADKQGKTPVAISFVGTTPAAPTSGDKDKPPVPPRDERPAQTRRAAYSDALTLVAGSGTDPQKWKDAWAGRTPQTMYDRDEDRAVILIDEAGKTYGPLPQVDEDDTIAVAVVPSSADATISDLRVESCARGKEVRVGGGAANAVIAARKADVPEPALHYETVVADHCGSEQGLKVTFKSGTTPVSVTVPTLSLNRFTVGLGILFDASRPSSFQARAIKGDSVPEIVDDRHLEGIATAVFVSLRLAKVDTVRPRRAQEMLSPAVGVSLTSPKDNLYLALNFEPYPGFGILVGYHAFRDDHLGGGYSVGDHFPTGQPPVDKRWSWWGHGNHWYSEPPLFVGVNLDSSLLRDLLAAISR